MKKTLALFLTVIIFCSCFVATTVTGNSASILVYGDWAVTKIGETMVATVYAYMGTDTEITIPEYVSNGTVYITGINDDFINNTTRYNDKGLTGDDITSIIIGDNITSIGISAFENSAITSVVLPKYLTSLGNRAFRNSVNLQTVDLSQAEGLTYLPSTSFMGCSSLTSIYISENIAEIRQQVFESCTSLEEIVFSDGVTSIHNSALRFCTEIKKISVGNGISDLSCFMSYSSLKEGLEELKVYNRDAFFPDTLFDACADTVTLYGWTGSTAESFAAEKGVPFIPFDPGTTEPETTEPETTEPETTEPETTEPETTEPETTEPETTEPETTESETTEITTENTTETEAVYYMLGDVTNDKNVTIKDVTYIQRALAMLDTFTSYQKVIGNVTKSGDLGIGDATELQRWLARLPAEADIGKYTVTFGGAVDVIGGNP